MVAWGTWNGWAHNWFDLLSTVGIVGSLWFTAVAFRSEARTRRTANLLIITANHREIWKEFSRNPALARVVDPTADVVIEAVPQRMKGVLGKLPHALALHRHQIQPRSDDDALEPFGKPPPPAADLARQFGAQKSVGAERGQKIQMLDQMVMQRHLDLAAGLLLLVFDEARLGIDVLPRHPHAVAQASADKIPEQDHGLPFEEAKLADGFFDVAISNIPFGDYKPFDPQLKSWGFVIHDYFFAKALDKVRPGGLVLFITSWLT